ncbi:MAG: VCBS repeat-containing protein [Deltaproteobacteria bacterium]|nr:VCBS repeat-containing protein [Deltaproteobacteria bacterium]
MLKPALYLLTAGLITCTAVAAAEEHLVCPNGKSKKGAAPPKPTILMLNNQKIKKGARITAFNKKFRQPVRCVTGDFNGDGTDDFLFGAGPGPKNTFSIIDGTTKEPTQEIFSAFLPFDANFKGGIFVAAGDVNNDSTPDIIVGAGSGSSEVRVIDGSNGARLNSFFAYDTSFTGGVRVATGDVNGDGVPDIITGPGNNGTGPVVRVFNGQTGSQLSSFNAYDSTFRGGVYVAAGDINNDGRADIITGAGAGGGPHVKIFDGATNSELQSFFAYAASFKGGVTVATGDINGDGQADIITGPGQGGRSKIIAFDGDSLSEIGSLNVFPQSYSGGVFVASQVATSTPTPSSFIDVLDSLDITSLTLTQETAGCDLPTLLPARLFPPELQFSGIPNNSTVVFTKQTQTSYTASGVKILGDEDHNGTLTADGCDVTFHFVNPTREADCQARYHFNPIGTPAEAILDTDTFATCP